MGKRMRPHTLSVPKPLIHVAGKPIVQRLVEEICSVSSEKIDEIAFVIGDFGKDVEESLITIAEKAGAKAHLFYQKEALGTAHAIFCAEKLLKGKTIIAFADTLFKATIKLQEDQESVIWVKEVENPEAFGVVKTTAENKITAFVEKPKTAVSNLAIIGIYYFKKAEELAKEIAFLLDNKILKNGEYQLTDALQNMMQRGTSFYANNINEWLDCGNKDATVYTNQRILSYLKEDELLCKTMKNHNSIIIPPCFIGENAKITNSIIGPYVSVGKNSSIINSVIENSIIQENSEIVDANLKNSMIGNSVEYKGRKNDVSIGDYTSFK